MNGNLNIELAHQHQQELVEYASRSRLAARPSWPSRRPSIAARWRSRWSARADASTDAVPQLATAGCTHR
jgi:hypothetical protein